MTPGQQHINSLIDKALLSIQKGDTNSGFAFIKEALSCGVHVRGLYYVLALCHMQSGEFADARRALEVELQTFPGDSDSENLLKFLDAEMRKTGGSGSGLQVRNPEVCKDSQPQRIVFVRTDSIGDNVIALGTLDLIKERYPGSEVYVVCQQHVAELYEACPLVHRVIPFEIQAAMYNQPYLNRLILMLQSLEADIAMTSVYSPSLLNHLLVLATKALQKIALRGDYSNISKSAEESSGILAHYTQLIETSQDVNEFEHHRDFLAGLGVKNPDFSPKMWLRSEDKAYAEALFAQHDMNPQTTVALFAAGQQDFKASLVFGYALADICRERGFSVIAIGGAEHFKINEENCVLSGSRYLNMCGKTTLLQSAAIIEHCRIAVGTDTGHAHIACAVGKPNVILLGGGHFPRFLPYSYLTSIVCLPLSCYGCNWYCRYPETYCIKDVSLSNFGTAIRKTLDEAASKPRVFFQTMPGPLRAEGYPEIVDIMKFFRPEEVECILLSQS